MHFPTTSFTTLAAHSQDPNTQHRGSIVRNPSWREGGVVVGVGATGKKKKKLANS